MVADPIRLIFINKPCNELGLVRVAGVGRQSADAKDAIKFHVLIALCIGHHSYLAVLSALQVALAILP